jgi:hypothetical protein
MHMHGYIVTVWLDAMHAHAWLRCYRMVGCHACTCMATKCVAMIGGASLTRLQDGPAFTLLGVPRGCNLQGL